MVIQEVGREQLAVVAQACIHRVAAQAYQPGLRQCEMDGAQVHEIEREFVDKPRVLPRAWPGAVDILATQLLHVDGGAAAHGRNVEHRG